MARLDLLGLPGDQEHFVDAQPDCVSSKMRTRVVAPPIPLDVLVELITGLNPVVRGDGRDQAFAAQSPALVWQTVTLVSARPGRRPRVRP